LESVTKMTAKLMISGLERKFFRLSPVGYPFLHFGPFCEATLRGYGQRGLVMGHRSRTRINTRSSRAQPGVGLLLAGFGCCWVMALTFVKITNSIQRNFCG